MNYKSSGMEDSYKYRHGFGRAKNSLGKLLVGTLPVGTYTITLAPYGKKGIKAKFVFSVETVY